MKKNIRGAGPKLYEKAQVIIPFGTQLLSKRPQLHLPEFWPSYYEKAKGCYVWDLDGRKLIDTSSMGVGACVLGYADPDVNKAVLAAVRKSSMCTLNCYEEVELAEVLCRLHPWADMARFSRTGGEAMSVAVRVARAATQKDIVLFCGYHGWHDWYLSANLGDTRSLDGHLLPGLKPRGVPRVLKETAKPFAFNDLNAFKELMRLHKGKIASVILEPIRNDEPQKGFLETIRALTAKENIVLIFDEISSGWRVACGGAHLNYKVYPDMAVFAKAMSNGFPMAAIIGAKKYMQAFETTFVSSTYWTERIGPVAALATIKKIRKYKVYKHLVRTGKCLQASWLKLARKHGLQISVGGMYPISHFSFQYPNASAVKTLFTQTMLEKGFLATTAFYVSFAHTEETVEKYLKAVDKTFSFIAKAIKEGAVEKYLRGPVCEDSFKRLN